MPETVIDTLVAILRRQAATGRRTAALSGPIRQALLEPARVRTVQPPPRPPPAPAASTAVAARREVPPPQAAPAAPPPAPAPAEPLALAGVGWEELERLVHDCRRCPLCTGRTQAVFGSGNRQAELMFVGEAPGRDEDAQGLPFVGAAGELLTKMIVAMQFERPAVYIANVLKCRPPRNRPPEASEAAACLPFLQRQIELVRPKVIVTLGATPLQELLGKSGIVNLHGQWCEVAGVPALPTFHPAYLLRVPERKREAWEDLKQAMVRLGRSPPAATNARQAPPAGTTDTAGPTP
jgi:uracil-DNA glycosylase